MPTKVQNPMQNAKAIIQTNPLKDIKHLFFIMERTLESFQGLDKKNFLNVVLSFLRQQKGIVL